MLAIPSGADMVRPTLRALWLFSWCMSDTGAGLADASWKRSPKGNPFTMLASWFANTSSTARSISCTHTCKLHHPRSTFQPLGHCQGHASP